MSVIHHSLKPFSNPGQVLASTSGLRIPVKTTVNNISLGLNTTFLTCSGWDVEHSSSLLHLLSDAKHLPSVYWVRTNNIAVYLEAHTVHFLLRIHTWPCTSQPSNNSPRTTLARRKSRRQVVGWRRWKHTRIRTQEDWQRRALCVGIGVMR